MPKTYGYGLRCNVFDAIGIQGMSKTQASKVFGISRNTINLWERLKAETGDLHPRIGCPRGKAPKVQDLEKFRRFVQHNSDQTQVQLA